MYRSADIVLRSALFRGRCSVKRLCGECEVSFLQRPAALLCSEVLESVKRNCHCVCNITVFKSDACACVRSCFQRALTVICHRDFERERLRVKLERAAGFFFCHDIADVVYTVCVSCRCAACKQLLEQCRVVCDRAECDRSFLSGFRGFILS